MKKQDIKDLFKQINKRAYQNKKFIDIRTNEIVEQFKITDIKFMREVVI